MFALAAWGTTGCHAFSRLDDCKQLIQVSNKGIKDLKGLDEANKQKLTADSYHHLSQRFSQLAKELSELDLEDKSIKKETGTIQKNFEKASGLAQRYNRLLRRLENYKGEISTYNRKQAEDIHKQMGKVVSDHKSHVRKVNDLCQPEG